MQIPQTNPHECVIVDNTNFSTWEIASYYRIAQLYNWPVKIVQIHCDFETACKRNTHQVPHDKIWLMQQTLLTERLPSHWKHEIVFPTT